MNFGDTEISFVAGQVVTRLDELGMGDDIDSMKVTCLVGGTPPQPPGPIPPGSIDSAQFCYVEVFEDENYSDASAKIMGPASLANLHSVSGKDWGDQIDSLRVGAKTRVEAWEDEDFADDRIVFEPNQNVSKLDELNFGDEIDSIRIQCLP